MERRNRRTVAINLTENVVGKGKRGITTWVGRCRSCLGVARWIELRQPVERLVGDSALCPVLPHRSEVAVKGTVLLREEDNVIHTLQGCGKVGGYVACIDSYRAG